MLRPFFCYVDDLVSREIGDEKLYVLQDANWNVVALCDIDGVVLERYTYDGFGKRNALMNSGIVFDRGFTGQILDAETGLMIYRNRYYSTGLGRFITRDPIGYMAGDGNLYRYVWNESPATCDPFGLQDWGSMFSRMSGSIGAGAPMTLVPPVTKSLPPAAPKPSSKPSKPTPRFYVAGEIVKPGPGFGRATAHATEGLHTDIYHLELGKIYEGWFGPPVEKQSLPSGPNWEIYPLERFTELEIVTAVPLLLPQGGFVSVATRRSEKAKIAWGPAKGKSCEDATEAEIIACIQEKTLPAGIPTVITNCQTDTQDAITGCCLKGFTGMGLGPTTLRHEIKGAK